MKNKVNNSQTEGSFNTKLNIPDFASIDMGEKSSKSFSMEQFLIDDGYLNTYYTLKTDALILCNKPLVGRIIIWMKRVIKRATKFYVQPIAEQQSRYNESLVRCINQTRNYIWDNATEKDLKDVEKDLKEMITDLQRQVDELKLQLIIEKNRVK